MFATPVPYSHSRLDLRSVDRVTLEDGLVARARLVDDKGQFLFMEDDPDFTRFISHADLFAGVVSGNIRVETDYHSLEKTQFRENWGELVQTDLTPEQLELPYHKQRLIKKYEELISSTSMHITAKMLKGLLRKWCNEINAEKREAAREEMEKISGGEKKPQKVRSDRKVKITEFSAPTPETFYRYYEKYVKLERNILALARKPTKPGCTRNKMKHSFEALAFATLWADKYYAQDKGKKKDLYAEYKANLALDRRDGKVAADCTEVTYDHFNRLIEAGATFDRVFTRNGPAKARKMFRPLREGNDITRPGELVQFDDHLFDLAVWLRLFGVWDSLSPHLKAIAETTRVWLTVGVDVATGWTCALKMAKDSSTKTVVDAIEMAVSDKTHIAQLCGAKMPWPQIPITSGMSDNGWNYMHRRVSIVASGVGINWERTPAEQPWLRGHCERTIRALSELALHALPGRTFANTIDKGERDPEKSAALLAEEFYALVIRLTVDYHHLRISGPRRQAAYNMVATYLQETKDGARKLVDLHTRRHVFGIAAKKVIHPDGILVQGIRYNSDQLQMVRQAIGNKPILTKSHEDDIRWISAQLRDGTWITVPSRERFPEKIGMFEWLEARKDVVADANKAQQPNLETMYEALRHRREVGDSSILAAGLTMHKPSHGEIRRQQRIMFEGVDLMAKGPLPALPALHFNGAELLANSFAAIKTAHSDLIRQEITPAKAAKTAARTTTTDGAAKARQKRTRRLDDYDAY